MEGQPLPPLFPEDPPQGEPVQLSHEDSHVVAEFTAAALDFIDGYLAEAVAHGVTAEEAAAQRSEVVESLCKQMETMEAGRYVPSPHAEEKLRLGHLELVMGNLDIFDRAGRAMVEANELTEGEFSIRRQELVERNMRALDDLGE